MSTIKDEKTGELYFNEGADSYVRYFNPSEAYHLFDTDEEGLYSYNVQDQIAYQIHRLDGPAIKAGNKSWYIREGRLHRVDGAAFIDGDTETDTPGEIYQEWWVYGIALGKEEYELYRDFITRAQKYLDDTNAALSEFETTTLRTSVCHSFTSREAFLDAASKNSLLISQGPRETASKVWKELPSLVGGSMVGNGLIAAGAIGAIGLVANALMSKSVRKKKLDIQANQVVS